MPFVSTKFQFLPLELQDQIYRDARELGATQAAKKHHVAVFDAVGMEYEYLRQKLFKYVWKIEKQGTGNMGGGSVFKVGTGGRGGRRMDRKKPVKLTEAQIALLDKFERGEVTFEEAGRLIARKAFERFLKYPEEKGSLSDFFRAEFIKIKQQKTTDKTNVAMEMLNRMFMGNLPTHCAKCGHSLFPRSPVTKALEGEVVNDSV